MLRLLKQKRSKMSTETDNSKTSKTAVNDITGAPILTKSSTEQYRDNWEKIFGKAKEEITDENEE
jgi:hypothetical protein